MDLFDQAQDYEERFHLGALNNHFALRADEKAIAHRRQLGFTSQRFPCIDFHQAIEPARLRACPSAMRCIDCQERHERIHGRRAS